MTLREAPDYPNAHPESDPAFARKHMENRRLNDDVIRNAVVSAHYAAQLGTGIIKPLAGYKESVERKVPILARLYMELSVPEAVAEYDALVNAFNADLERIKREDDRAAVAEFVRQALRMATETR